MTPLRKALAAGSIALALASVPSRLVAEEGRAAPAQARASVLEWFSGIWSEVTALFGAQASPPHPGSGGGPTTQGSCASDPFGGCTPGG